MSIISRDLTKLNELSEPEGSGKVTLVKLAFAKGNGCTQREDLRKFGEDEAEACAGRMALDRVRRRLKIINVRVLVLRARSVEWLRWLTASLDWWVQSLPAFWMAFALTAAVSLPQAFLALPKVPWSVPAPCWSAW
jgi:hypothetical protein